MATTARRLTRLCQDALEPLQRHVGQLVIRSGFRSARLNAFGAAHRLKCGSNEGNYAYHIWDHLDAEGYKGAAVCIVAPRFNDEHPGNDGKYALARIIDEHLNYHSVTFFAHDNALNIGWYERLVRSFYPRQFTPIRSQ